RGGADRPARTDPGAGRDGARRVPAVNTLIVCGAVAVLASLVVFGVWSAVGLVVYFAYGRSRSRLGQQVQGE
ncbi:hypothetical protein K7G98_42850, partial [Saccharothrix sp. MB29]|nr:hypothetical protein [Saccharothrix sp. MB29]